MGTHCHVHFVQSDKFECLLLEKNSECPPIHSFIAEFMRLGNTDTWHLSRALWALKRTVFESYPRGSSSECAVV